MVHDGAQYALEEIGAELLDLRDFGHGARTAQAPAGRSPGASEIAGVTELQRPYLLDLTSMLQVRFTVAEDLLATCGAVLRTPRVAMGLIPPARAASEMAAALCWILDPQLTATQRIGRLFGERKKSIDEQHALPVPRRYKDEIKERLRYVMSQAARCGITPEPPPGSTQLVSQAFGDTDQVDPEGNPDQLGKLMYKLAAAGSHGTVYALTGMIDVVRDGDGKPVRTMLEGQMVGQYRTHASRDATTLTLPVLIYRKAAVLWGAWMGHDVADWTAAIDLIGKELHQWVGRNPGASGRRQPTTSHSDRL